MRLLFIAAFCLVLALFPAKRLVAQTDDTHLLLLKDTVLSTSATDGRLFLDIDANTFLRDAEFFLPYSQGYTATGFRLSPTIRYNANGRTLLRGGVMLTRIAGTDDFWQARPILTIDYQANSWLRLVMGTLYGSLNHQLGEPIYDDERWFVDYKEDGVQMLTNTSWWHSDTWLNWEHYLKPRTADQERFSLGTRQEFVIGNGNAFSASFPFSFLGSHRGGQISTLDTCIETLFNESIGLKLRLEQKNLFQVNLPLYFYQNASPKTERYTAYNQGWGFYPQITFACRSNKNICSGHRKILGDNVTAENCSEHRHTISFSLGYWRAHNFQSSHGSYMFQSVSAFDSTYTEPERKMITAKVMYEHHFEHLALAFDAVAYYDLYHKKTDFVLGLYIRFKQNFRLL